MIAADQSAANALHELDTDALLRELIQRDPRIVADYLAKRLAGGV